MSRSIKHRYARVANSVGAGLQRIGLLDGPTPQSRFRHWLVSLTHVHDSLAIADLDVPWWSYKAIDAVEEWLSSRSSPVRAFEYGSGASTLWLASRCQQVHTVEHHRDFFASIRPTFDERENIVPHLVEPTASVGPQTPSGKSGYASSDFTDYVSTIDETGGYFDLIVIDGRARTHSLGASLPRLAPNGIIVFDNSLRRRYRGAIVASNMKERRFFGLTPTLPYPEQTSILTATS
jgi:hypothetical protein